MVEEATPVVDDLGDAGGLGSLGDQVLGALVAIAWSAVFTAVIGLAIKFTIGWRIHEEDEIDGIDYAEHGESAYDLHNAASSRTGVLDAATVASPSPGNGSLTEEGVPA